MIVKAYVTLGCPYCQKIMNWLNENNVEHELVVFKNTSEKKEFYDSTGFSTVPQIYVNNVHVGGWTDFAKSDFKKNIESAK